MDYPKPGTKTIAKETLVPGQLATSTGGDTMSRAQGQYSKTATQPKVSTPYNF